MKDHNFENVYIYTDLIEDQIVGHVMAPLLTHVAVSSSMFDDFVYVKDYNPVQYVGLRFGHIKNITVHLRDDTGRKVVFQTGKAIVVLHFRHRRQ